VTRVRALESRAHLALEFPHVLGYRWDVGGERLEASFGLESRLALSTQHVPTVVRMEPIAGLGETHTLGDLATMREGAVAFGLARVLIERHFRDDDGNPKHWLYPQLVTITRRWLRESLSLRDDTFPGLLLLSGLAERAAGLIHGAIVRGSGEAPRLLPRLRPYDSFGSTRGVDFDTVRPTWPTGADRSHISHVVADTGSWEQKTAQALEDMHEVLAYAKNDHIGFTIPYLADGVSRLYYPDFLVRWDDGAGPDDPLNLIVEVSGEKKADKAAKVATARDLWVPAINGLGSWGRWAFVEVDDPWNAKTVLRAAVAKLPATAMPADLSGVS
jgi:type III restriction enzyme